jgi:hypothetical protein
LLLAALSCSALVLAACAPTSSAQPTATPPALSDFRLQAVGTPIPRYSEYQQPSLPAGVGGVSVLNKAPLAVRVGVSQTIAEIAAGEAFLFILPEGEYTFYVFDLTKAPLINQQRVEVGKTRFMQVFLPPKE